MIQRVQTVYLAITIILLSIVSVGPTLFSFVNETSRFTYSSYGITEYSVVDGKMIESSFFPIAVGLISLVLLCFVCLMSYKNLARQHKLSRTIFYIYFLSLVTMILLASFGNTMLDAETQSRELGVGFFLFVIGFPFVFLANIGIKRDKKLLESLDRLR